jgi:SHS2 domain-containing protein
MTSYFKFIDHTADIAVEVKADSIQELFVASAQAFKEAVVNPDAEKVGVSYNLKLNSHSLEALLVNFLNELNFRLISKKKIFNNVNGLKIHQKNDDYSLECVLLEHDVDEDNIKTEIKSVTYHQMEIKKINGTYSTKIIFDI